MRATVIALLLLLGGCQTAWQAAKDGAQAWWDEGGKDQVIAFATTAAKDVGATVAEDLEEKLAKEIEEKTGHAPSFYEKPDGSIDWSALFAAGLPGAGMYLGWRKLRQAREKWKGVVSTAATSPPVA